MLHVIVFSKRIKQANKETNSKSHDVTETQRVANTVYSCQTHVTVTPSHTQLTQGTYRQSTRNAISMFGLGKHFHWCPKKKASIDVSVDLILKLLSIRRGCLRSIDYVPQHKLYTEPKSLTLAHNSFKSVFNQSELK